MQKHWMWGNSPAWKNNFYSNALIVYLENLAMDSCGHFEMVLFLSFSVLFILGRST